jgi:hypothetical protein
MKRTIRILFSLTFVFAIIFIAGFTADISVENGVKNSDSTGCVILSKWADCNDSCADAKCYQFKNNCNYDVKITIETKNQDSTWTTSNLYLGPDEESQEAAICSYIDIKWSYEKINLEWSNGEGKNKKNNKEEKSLSEDCVVISKWVDFKNNSADAISFKFKNICTYKVKIIYKKKNIVNTWGSHELYLEPDKESQETIICPYVDMIWSYERDIGNPR